MRTILVLNSKGGSGKTTLATNIAVYYALRGMSVALADFDKQASSLDWLSVRPDDRPPIRGITAAGGRLRIPAGTDYAIMDAPAGLHGKALAELVRRVETIVVPVVPSPIDLRAAERFHEELLDIGNVQNRKVAVATVGNRVREHSPGRFDLEEFLGSLKLPGGRKLPFVTYLRHTQNYLRAAERGLGIWEGAPSQVGYDLELWRPLMRWLNSKRSLPG